MIALLTAFKKRYFKYLFLIFHNIFNFLYRSLTVVYNWHLFLFNYNVEESLGRNAPLVAACVHLFFLFYDLWVIIFMFFWFLLHIIFLFFYEFLSFKFLFWVTGPVLLYRKFKYAVNVTKGISLRNKVYVRGLAYLVSFLFIIGISFIFVVDYRLLKILLPVGFLAQFVIFAWQLNTTSLLHIVPKLMAHYSAIIERILGWVGFVYHFFYKYSAPLPVGKGLLNFIWVYFFVLIFFIFKVI